MSVVRPGLVRREQDGPAKTREFPGKIPPPMPRSLLVAGFAARPRAPKAFAMTRGSADPGRPGKTRENPGHTLRTMGIALPSAGIAASRRASTGSSRKIPRNFWNTSSGRWKPRSRAPIPPQEQARRGPLPPGPDHPTRIVPQNPGERPRHIFRNKGTPRSRAPVLPPEHPRRAPFRPARDRPSRVFPENPWDFPAPCPGTARLVLP